MKIRQFSKRIRTIVQYAGGICIAFGIVVLFLVGAFEILELQTYDWRFRLRGEREPLKDIVLIIIDETSKKALQQPTPWKRSMHAEMIRTLMKHQPKLIVYDMLFQTATEPDQDEAFANALYDAFDEQRGTSLVLLAEYIAQAMERPLQMFAENAGGVGVINLDTDRDNLVRSVSLAFLTMPDSTVMGQDPKPQYHLCLSLQAAALLKGVNRLSFPDAETLVLSKSQEQTSPEVLRVQGLGRKLYINYIGGRYAYPMIAFADILQGKYKPEDIAGKILFIGDTSLTAHDYHLTPFQTPVRKYVRTLQADTLKGGKLTNVPLFGLEIHAQALQTILEHSYIRKIPVVWSVLLILCVGTVTGILLFTDRGFFLNTAMIVFSGGMVWGICQVLFNTRNLWIDLAPLEIAILVNYIAGLAFQRAVALYNRNQVKGAFQQYVSTAVVEEMLKHPEKLHLGGERKFLTVLFSDIRGFTSISEKMESQALVEFLNKYLTAMTDIILHYHGTLDKYMGDAIMAIYGAPLEQPEHAIRACATALDMMAKLHELQQKWRAQGLPFLNIGIGINSGQMTVGNMGSEKRFDFTVMGDHVNLGSRLEGTNKEYGTNIIISEYTYQAVKDAFVVRELDYVRVKGKQEPVKIYELVGRTGQVDPTTLARFTQFEAGLAAYRNRLWDEALSQFEQVLRLDPNDAPAQLYLHRCREYQVEPPPENWDQVYTMKTK